MLAHTIHGGVVADVRCEGRSLGELGLNAALAAHSGVPAVLVAGRLCAAQPAVDRVQVGVGQDVTAGEEFVTFGVRYG